MIINGNDQTGLNNRNNSCGTKLFKVPIKKLNIQSRNINNYGISPQLQRNSLSSTKEATPRKEQKTMDDSLSQISEILQHDKKHINFSDLVGKIPGISNEPNFAYDLILYNKRKINKAKKLSKKIGVLKLHIYNGNNINDKYKETLGNAKNKKSSDTVTCCFFRK